MRRLLLITICLMLGTQLMAGPVTVDQARQKASQFLKGRVAARARGSAPAASELKMSAVGKDDSYYIFNAGNNEGFVVVSGEDATEEILGYSDTGSIDPASMPCGMRMLFDNYTEQIKFLRENGITKGQNNSAQDAQNNSFRIGRTLAKYDQYEPYNNKCPKSGMLDLWKRCPTGCVATAMAQLMYYYRWPRNITNTIPAYVTDEHGYEIDEIPSGTIIDWINILPDYSKYETEQGDAIADLMKYCGASVRMDYDVDGSGAVSAAVPYALKHYFGYENVVFENASSYKNVTLWYNKLRNEIENNGPVYYRGEDNNGGSHAFLLEGYDDSDRFLINFGWGGSSNDFFMLNTICAPFEFINNQGALFNVTPKSGATSDNVPSRLWTESLQIKDNGPFLLSQETGMFPNIQFSFKVIDYTPKEIMNYDCAIAVGEFPVVLFTDEKFSYGSSFSADDISLSIGDEINNGKYKIALISRETGTDSWDYNDNSEHEYAEMCIAGNKLHIKDNTNDGTNFSTSNLIQTEEKTLRVGQESSFKLKFIDSTSPKYYDGAFLVELMWKDSKGEHERVILIDNLTFTNKEAKDYQFSFVPTVAGEQQIRILNKRWDVVSSQTIKVLAADESQDMLEVKGLTIANQTPDGSIDGTYIDGSLTLHNLDDVVKYEQLIVMLVDVETGIVKSKTMPINIAPNSTVTYGFMFTNLIEGHRYRVWAEYKSGTLLYESEPFLCTNDDTGETIPGNEDLTGYEYWFDDDFAGRKTVSMNSSSEVVRAAIETDHLDDGVHRFNFRLRRSDNKFSAVSSRPFLKLTKEKKGHFDYWIDDDIENRASLPLQDTEEEQELSLDLSGIPTGYHRVNYQLATPGAVMGNTYSEGVMKLASGVPNELEYWFDDNVKNCKRLTGTRSSSNDGYIYDANIDLSGLTQGLHRLNIRATSSGNTRGSVLSYDVLKFATGKATKLEYWFDDDQTNIKLLDGKLASDGNDYIFDYDLDMSKLTMGLHRLNIRPSSGQGTTSGALISTNVFKLAAGVASKLEYWFDDDLEGSQKLDGKLASDGKDYIFSNELNLSSLPLGMHRLNIRATDAEGTNLGAVFSYDVLKLASGKATRLEYWFDGDKEHSRLLDGTASDTGVNDYVFVKDLNMSCLEPGHHRLFYRSVSESGMTSGAISETPIIVKSRYNVSDPTTLDVTRYSFWVDNESNPEVMDVEDPTYGKTFRHELDARNLKEGDHVVHLKFWNSMGVAVSEEVPFKAVQVDNPSISLTAEEKNGEVTVRFNTVAYDMSYTLYRKNESGVKTMIATKGSCYPTNLVWRGTLPAGSYTYYVECVYTDKSGNEQTLTSNEATVSIAKTVTIAYGSITGILMTDGAMLPSSGVSVVLTPTSGESRTVKVDTYGKFICEKLPLNSQWTLTVTGDDLHEFDAKTVIIEKEGNLTVKLSGKQKEESEEERITKEHDLALNSTLDCAQNLAFEVKNLSSSKWTGTIEVVAIRKDKMYNFYDNQIPLPVTTELTIKGNDTQQIYIPLEALGRLNKDREYNFKFTTKGKYDTYYSYYRERPLYLAKEYSEDGWYVTQLVEKDRHNQDNIPWTTEQSVYFANLLVKLHSLIGGMNGKIGDADQFRADVVKAAKTLTGKYDEKEAVEGMIRWMEGKNALEILANPTIATLSEALTFASPVSASLPLSLKSKLSYAIDGATKAMDYLNGVIAVYDFVKAESDYEKFFVCANWICNVASKTNPLYSILMNSYLVVSKSMITKVIEMGEKLYKRKEAQLLQMNELSSSDGYKYATINKQIDFKIRVKKSGKGYFTPAEIIKQIDYVEAKVSNNSNSPDVVTFKMVEDGDYVALKQTAYNGGGVDDGFELKQFDLEIHWNNKRVTMVPLAEGDGVDFDKGSGSSDERYIKPACYTIVFKSDSNTPESMSEFIHLK